MKNTAKFIRHIKALRAKHRALDEKITALGNYPDIAELRQLKRQKLKLKEEIRRKVLARWRDRRVHRTSSVPLVAEDSSVVEMVRITTIAAE